MAKPVRKKLRIDWKKRDVEYCQNVEKLAKEILSSSDYPVQLTITGLSKRLNFQHMVNKTPHRIPKTLKMLKNYAENTEEFIVRRINYVTESFVKENIYASKSAILTKVRVSKPTLVQLPKVQTALDKSFAKLEKLKNSGFISKK